MPETEPGGFSFPLKSRLQRLHSGGAGRELDLGQDDPGVNESTKSLLSAYVVLGSAHAFSPLPTRSAILSLLFIAEDTEA